MTPFAVRWAAVAILGLAGPAAPAQEKVSAPEEIKTEKQLEAAVGELDRQLFEAYNHCDLKKFDSLLADDVEFYHDQGGVTLGHAALTESVRNNICTGDTQRVLVPGTLKIYPMKGFGAIEMGVHRFTHPRTGATNGTGEASFVHLWRYKDGAWKLSRALSYDHHPAQASPLK
jgi:ketosteroid isomerase-like protein